jgi:hypothetical protein
VKDLFGVEIKPVLYTKGGRAMKAGPQGGKHYVQPRGYGGKPGTGPKGETCGTCKNCYRKRMSKTYTKCLLAQAAWTGGRATDILARTAACDKWEPS